MAETNAAYVARAKAQNIPEAKARELSEKDIETARKQFEAIYEADHEIRARVKKDHEYVDGVYADGKPMRWDRKDLDARGDRPSLSIDAMSGSIAQVVNGIADGKPAADMMPIGHGASDEKAEVWEGLLRRIQTAPEAEYAASWAAEHLVKLGRGAWVVTARYPEYNGNPTDPANWEMELCREWIENQHGVWCGPATRPDGSDRMVAFILQPLTEDLFDARFGEGAYNENKSAIELLAKSAGLTAWSGPKTLTVATWYRVKTTMVTIRGVGPDGLEVSRQVPERTVCVSTITATKEYEYSELPIPYIPIVFGEARKSNIDGQKDCKGMVRGMKDAQDLLNVWPSYIAETIPQSARQEVIAAEGQIDDANKGFWDLAKRLPYRLYKALEMNGHYAPPPTIQGFEAPIQAMTLALQQAEGFVRKTAGFYDADSDQTRASLSKESGVARRIRQQQGEMGTSDFARTFGFMMLFEIKLLMAWARHVYTAARVQRITGRDEEDMVAVTHFGEGFAQDAQQMAQQMPQRPNEKQAGVFDLSSGRYDMRARVTKNPLTERQENVEMLQDVLPLMPPEMAAKAFPVMLDEMEGTVMRKIAAVLNPKQQTVSVAEAQKAQEFIDGQTKVIEDLARKLETKEAETASKERIEQARLTVQLEIEKAKLDFEREKLLHEAKMKEYELQQLRAQAEFDAHQADLDREHSSAEAAAGREHEMVSGDHAAAREFALREPEVPQDGATA